MMENDMFSPEIDMDARNSMVVNGISSHMTSDPMINPFDRNNDNQVMPRCSVVSCARGDSINDLHAGIPMVSPSGIVDCGSIVSSYRPLGKNAIEDTSNGSLHPISDSELRERFGRGPPTSAKSLGALSVKGSGRYDNLNDLALAPSVPFVLPSEILRTDVSNDCTINASNPYFVSLLNCGYDRTAERRTGFEPPQFMGGIDSDEWISRNGNMTNDDKPYGSSRFSNDLSLSLASSQPSIVCGATIPDQCLEIGCPGETHHCSIKAAFGSEQVPCNNKELSLSYDSYRPAQLSQALSGSIYLRAIREMFSEIVSYSLNNSDHTSYSTTGFGCRTHTAEREVSIARFGEFPNGDGACEVQTEPTLPRQEVEARKAQLLALLQVVDEQYNRCLDEIHTVISAFHAATELDPQIHARFALQTISFSYKSLRERISNRILLMGADLSNPNTREREDSFGTSFIQKQWAIQQLRRKDHRFWKPQRGLPERSVSVLRSWMFQNFLHPYPKDAEKHILAVRSGLTRSQVSNWFINARVRIWKPMIEKMYAEVNRRKDAHLNDAGNQQEL